MYFSYYCQGVSLVKTIYLGLGLKLKYKYETPFFFLLLNDLIIYVFNSMCEQENKKNCYIQHSQEIEINGELLDWKTSN